MQGLELTFVGHHHARTAGFGDLLSSDSNMLSLHLTAAAAAYW